MQLGKDSQVHLRSGILAWCCWLGTPRKGQAPLEVFRSNANVVRALRVSLICPTWWGGPTHVIQTCSAPPRPDTNNPSRPRSTLRISAFRPPAVASSSPEFHSRVITPLCHGTAIAASKLERPRNPRPKFKKPPDGKKKTSESTHHLVRPFRTLCCARIVVVSSPNPPLP